MRRFSLTIYHLGPAWASYPEKIKQTRDFFASVCDLDITVRTIHVTPVFELDPSLNRPGQAPLWTVDRKWYDQYVSAASSTDLVCLMVPPETHPDKVTVMGLMTGKDPAPWELTVYANENDHLYVNGQDLGNAAAWYLIHELSHAFYAMLGKGLGTGDVTHTFFNQKDTFSPAVLWDPKKVLQDFKFPEIPAPEPKSGLQLAIEALKNIVLLLISFGKSAEATEITQVIDLLEHQSQPPSPPKPDYLTLFCNAIKEHEGWYPPSPAYPSGSRAYRNKNPGNVKYVPGMSLAIGRDSGNFAIFKTEADGMEFLRRMVTNAATGKSSVYSPTMTIAQFFAKYAPASDNNVPARYAAFVAERCGLPVTTKISAIVA